MRGRFLLIALMIACSAFAGEAVNLDKAKDARP